MCLIRLRKEQGLCKKGKRSLTCVNEYFLTSVTQLLTFYKRHKIKEGKLC